ncbi:hypothetical protein M090_1316 [Parabacteroides distasonis str. 3776 Po2 i]|nr:hypothetical protein M090_1316 [Parabacteroides distasonis str. 3776 Po2 i]KDS64082.1 hypothetical protein M095_3381 [Parabacteroides distasonis str. 3999B T(B) 4]
MGISLFNANTKGELAIRQELNRKSLLTPRTVRSLKRSPGCKWKSRSAAGLMI